MNLFLFFIYFLVWRTRIALRLFALFGLILVSSWASADESNLIRSRPKKQYIENDTYFKSSQLLSINEKIRKEEKPWGVGVNFSSSTDISKSHNDRIYNQTLEISGAYKLTEKYGLGLQTAVGYYTQDNNIPKVEGNPKWDDLSLSLSQKLGELFRIEWKQSVYTFAPISYDTQFEGIKSGLSYDLEAAHNLFFINIVHKAIISYTVFSSDYSPTTGRLNSPWSNSYTLSVSVPYKINKQLSVGASERALIRSSFDNDYFLKTSTLVFGGYKLGKLQVSINYLIGSYDENESLRYFYVNEWQQKVSVGLTYEI